MSVLLFLLQGFKFIKNPYECFIDTLTRKPILFKTVIGFHGNLNHLHRFCHF